MPASDVKVQRGPRFSGRTLTIIGCGLCLTCNGRLISYRPNPNVVAAIRSADPDTAAQHAAIIILPITVSNAPIPASGTSHLMPCASAAGRFNYKISLNCGAGELLGGGGAASRVPPLVGRRVDHRLARLPLSLCGDISASDRRRPSAWGQPVAMLYDRTPTPHPR
jgi:hypothetical protein